MALFGNTSGSVSFDVNLTPDAFAGFVGQQADRVNNFVNDNMEDIDPVVAAFKPPLEEYILRCQATEETRLKYMVNMLQLLSNNFLPNVETCDEDGFANCIIDSNQGVNFDRYDWNADIFSQPCAATYGCQIKADLDRQGSRADGQLFENNATALMDNINA